MQYAYYAICTSLFNRLHRYIVEYMHFETQNISPFLQLLATVARITDIEKMTDLLSNTDSTEKYRQMDNR